jgi:hypothetical protein
MNHGLLTQVLSLLRFNYGLLFLVMKRPVLCKRNLAFSMICFFSILCAWVILRDVGLDRDHKKGTNETIGVDKSKVVSNLLDSQNVYQRLNDPELLKKKGAEAEKARLARWKAEFPWQPTYDPKVKFNVKRHVEVSNPGVKSATDMATCSNHRMLKKFFKDEIRFSSQFEKFYRILKEHDRGDNPVMVGQSFWAFRQYYYAAFENDPDDFVFRSGKKVRKGLFSYRTWADEAASSLESLRGYLRHWEWLNPEFATESGKADSMALIERLSKEVIGMEDLPLDIISSIPMFGVKSKEVQMLLNGEEELLVPYVGWNEQSELYWAEQQRQFRISFENGDPTLKAAAPELFPPVGVKNGRLVDKDGDPVAWREGMEVSLVNERGEVVPAIIEEDGSIGLPTPDEVDLLRAQGKLRPANFEELHPDLYHALGMGKTQGSVQQTSDP